MGAAGTPARGAHAGTGPRRGEPDEHTGIVGANAFADFAEESMTVDLGLPGTPPPVLAERRKTRQLQVGAVGVGSDHPISVQSMTTTNTADINSTLQQIAELTASGCDIVRVACPSADDAEALPAIAQKSKIPVIADIHFQPKYVFAAIEAGCAGVRVNPGNIRKFDDQVKEIAHAAKDHGTPIRIGVNAGSLDKRLMEKHGKATPEALAESALWEASLFAEHDFHDLKISVKHNDPVVMVRAYEILAEQCDYPLHLGVTEAGPAFQGTIKSAVAFGALLRQGIGDTIRVSLSAPPVEEIKVGTQILQSLNLRPRKLEIVSCPSCGRAQVDVYKLADEVTAGLEGMEVPLRVAVMGCVVNGPGEAREADLGVASGNGKGQIFVKGEVIKTVPEAQIVETLIEEAMRIAEENGDVDESGEPVVTVG
ncbi:4-hydroxy-3-methylbut-2-en-1-yl diphosphate synthase [Prauserella aidingensis]|nr:4-hydroxy-3-methylbut-2-en-1-yl diphosphate synthase [Prauserella aidingensis]